MTNYPNNLDNIITLPTVDGVTQQDVAINALQAAVIAIETELGITPSGPYSTVGTRLSILESRILYNPANIVRPYAPQPAVVSITINPFILDVIDVIWSMSVTHGSLKGLSLIGDTSAIITDIVTGDTTATISYKLSEQLQFGTQVSFVVDADNGVNSAFFAMASPSITEVPLAELIGPQLIAAYVPTEDRDRLWLDFEYPVNIENLTLVTINVITGTNRTISSVVSGDGTNSLILALSGDLDTNTVMTVSLAAGAFSNVSDGAKSIAQVVNHTWYTAPAELSGFTMGRVASNAMSGGTWPSGFGDSIVWGTLSGTIDTISNGYEGFNVQRFEKSAPDYLYISTPGSNQLGTITSTTAWNSWTFFIPQSLGTDSAPSTFYNNEGVVGSQGLWGVALRSGAGLGADSAKAQVTDFDGTYIGVEVPLELHTPACIRGRLASSVMYARRDLGSETSIAHTGTTLTNSVVLIGATSTTAGRQADVDVLAFITANQDQPAQKSAGIMGWAQRQQWGSFLRPQPLFPKMVYAVVGEPVSLCWESCILIGYPAAISVSSSGVGTSNSSGWSWTPTSGDIGEHIVEVTISNLGGNKLRSANFKVKVSTATATGTVTIAHVGDSNIASVTIPTQTRTALTAQGLTCTLIGALGSNPNKHDGTGGWSWDETLIGQSGVPSQFANFIINATAYDIQSYVDGYGLPNVVYCHFGTNDIATYGGTYGENPTTYEVYLNTVIANAEAFIDAWHNLYPNVKIVIGHPLPINARQSAFTANYGTGIRRWQMRRMIHRLTKRYIDAFSRREHENVFLLATQVVDSTSDYDGTNAVHPLTVGLDKVGKQIAAWYRAQF